jgi:3-oxoacyl-[acyl-carrier protein] reductase
MPDRVSGGMRLKERVAIVTGAGRGIGRAIAVGFAREGAAVIVNYSRSADSAREVVRQIREAGGHAEAVRADVKELGEHDRLVTAGSSISARCIFW